MLLGRVIGTVWATRKDPKLEGTKLEIVRQLALDLTPLPSFLIAIDSVGAGVGEVVLVAQGSSARQTQLTKDRPCDAVTMAIVERHELENEDALLTRAEELDRRIGSCIEQVPEN